MPGGHWYVFPALGNMCVALKTPGIVPMAGDHLMPPGGLMPPGVTP